MTYNNHNDNPWQDQPGQTGQGHQEHNPYQTQEQHHQSPNPYVQQPAQHQDTSPWSQETSQHQSHNTYNPQHAPQPPYNQDRPHPTYPQQAPQQTYPGQEEVPPSLPPRRSATDMALPTGQDRSHQIEVMQSYEAAGRKDEDDANVEILQREFPNIDGSLIAAIYGDSKSLSATREMLQALE